LFFKVDGYKNNSAGKNIGYKVDGLNDTERDTEE
tara:strand:+ start:621 stop:722 length:102 start_codon:yes stop_codon:yes gene_type:complete